MMTTNLPENVLHQSAHLWGRDMNTRNQLRDDLQPILDGNSVEAVTHCSIDLRCPTVFEPERQDTQAVLETVPAGQADGPEEALNGGDDVRIDAMPLGVYKRD